MRYCCGMLGIMAGIRADVRMPCDREHRVIAQTPVSRTERSQLVGARHIPASAFDSAPKASYDSTAFSFSISFSQC